MPFCRLQNLIKIIRAFLSGITNLLLDSQQTRPKKHVIEVYPYLAIF